MHPCKPAKPGQPQPQTAHFGKPLATLTRHVARDLFAKQTGAMFGLDARIALAIFGVLSLVAGTAIVINLNQIRGKALASELSDTGRAVESLIGDIDNDLFASLDQPSEKNAFTALFDNAVITETDNRRARWLGPYIKYTSAVHPRYGEMLIQQRAADHTVACTPEAACYLWLVYSNVPINIITEVNELMDSTTENLPATSGRVQWTVDKDNAALYYRTSKVMTYRDNQ